MRPTSGPANHRYPGGLSDGQADHIIASDEKQETSPTASNTEHTDDSIEDRQRRSELLHLRPSQTTISATREDAPQANSTKIKKIDTHARTHTHTHTHARYKHAPTINQILSFSLPLTHTHHTTTHLIRINDSTLKNIHVIK